MQLIAILFIHPQERTKSPTPVQQNQHKALLLFFVLLESLWSGRGDITTCRPLGLAPLGNNSKEFFPKIQRRSLLGIKPATFSITDPTHFKLAMRCDSIYFPSFLGYKKAVKSYGTSRSWTQKFVRPIQLTAIALAFLST